VLDQVSGEGVMVEKRPEEESRDMPHVLIHPVLTDTPKPALLSSIGTRV
jgi:hypothetical protein